MITFGKFNIENFSQYPIVTDKFFQTHCNLNGCSAFILPCGEQAKSFIWVEKLCKWFLSLNLTKQDTIVAIGGGSVGDTVGFAASIYKRGINLILVPTTLLSQIDSAIGGKTALDLDGVKNAVGTFIKADTFIDCTFLQTLSPKQMTDGYGELYKYCMQNAKIDQLVQNSLSNLPQIVQACVQYKQSIVQSDFFDTDQRHILNMGHTIAHGLELQQGITHGQAVLCGLYYELQISYVLGFASSQYVQMWQEKIKKITQIANLDKATIQLMLQDKKSLSSKIGFVLPCDGYSHKSVQLSMDEVCRILEIGTQQC